MNKVSLFIENSKAKKTPSEEIHEEFEKELENLRPLKDEVVKPSKKKKKITIEKKVLIEQFAKRREEKEKKKGHMGETNQEEKEEEDFGQSNDNAPLSNEYLSKNFFPFKGGLPRGPFTRFSFVG
uniref:Protein MNN4-like n=1 Tax=Cucumis melo TaxID=3656 RepID=A0A9I9CXN0_CUCME